MENRRQQAQAQRKHDSQQWQIKKDDLPAAPLFGPPIKVNKNKNDPVTKRIKDVLGDHKSLQRFIQSSSLIGVDRLPQTPASPFPKGSEHLFPDPPSKLDRKSYNAKNNKDRSNSTSKEHKSRRSRSRSKEKHDKSAFEKVSSQNRSHSLDRADVMKNEKRTPENRLSQESGYITGGSLETLNELEGKHDDNGKNHEKTHSYSSHKEREKRMSSDSGHLSKFSNIKSGHDPPDGLLNKPHQKTILSHSRKNCIKNLPPLTLPEQKRMDNGGGHNIDRIFGEVSLQPPLTAIQTPGKEVPIFAQTKIHEIKSQKSSGKTSGGRSLRRVSSGGLYTDLQVSSDSEDEDHVNVPSREVKDKLTEKISSKKDSGKKNKKMTGGQKNMSDSSDMSDDSDSESDSMAGSQSETSSSEDEMDKYNNKSNLSKNDSAGSGGLFDVSQDQPSELNTSHTKDKDMPDKMSEKSIQPQSRKSKMEALDEQNQPSTEAKPQISFNLQEFKKKMLQHDTTETKAKVSPNLISPIKENVSLVSELSPEKTDYKDCVDRCFADILNDKCFGSGKLSPCPPSRNEGTVREESTVTSTSGSCKSSSKALIGDITSKTYGIACINPDNEKEDEEVKEIHLKKASSPHFKPIVYSPNHSSNSSAKNSQSNNNVLKHGSSNENIPDSEPLDNNSYSRSKSKSKRSQSSSDKSNQKATTKLDSRQSSISSKSPSRRASKSEKKKSKTSSGSVKSNSTPKKVRKTSSKHPKTVLSKEFLPSSDSSSSELSSHEHEHEDTFVDIEALSSPEKDKPLIKSSSPKLHKAIPKISELNHDTSSPKNVATEYSNKKNKSAEPKAKQKSKLKDKSEVFWKANRNTSSNSSLDLSHILDDVCAPDELLSPVPSAPNLIKLGKAKEDIKPLNKKATPLRASVHMKEEVDADSTVVVDATIAQKCQVPELRFINGVPSIIVSIDLNLLNLPKRTSCIDMNGVKDNSYVKTHQHFSKSGENIFQNLTSLKEGMKLDLPTCGDFTDSLQHSSTATITPDIVPSELFPQSVSDNEHFDCHTDNTVDTDTFNTNSASQNCHETVPVSSVTGTTVARVVKEPEPVDISHIIDLEGIPPPTLKIPKKRRNGDGGSRERIKKPRTDERHYRGSSPHRSIESPQYGKRLSDYDRRSSRERYKRCRIDEPAVHDECSQSPSIRESPRWSVQGSDHRRTPRYEDYSQSDRESVHHDEEHWELGKDRSETLEHGSILSSHPRDSRRGGISSRYDRDKWRDRDRDRRDRDRYDRDRQKPRKYSRDWDAPSDDQYPESHSPAYPHPVSFGSRGAASQWSEVVSGHIPPYTPRESRHERIYEEDRPPFHHYRRKVAPVNEKLESANHYLEEAKKLKHQADKIQEKPSKMIVYVDAFLSFIQCGYAMEQENVSQPTKICKMYQDTLKLIRYCMVGHDGSDKPDNIMIKKLSVFSFRIQSVLCLRLYKLKKGDTTKLKRIIDDHNKSANSKPSVQAPSPYSHTSSTTQSSGNGSNGWKGGTSGTPSPMSPQPSPAGSVGSVGSVGSGDHPKMVNGNVSSTTVCVPQRIHSVTQEYLKNLDRLYQCHEVWDQADANMEDKEFFDSLDRDCGHLSMQSSVPELVRYIKEGLNRLKAT